MEGLLLWGFGLLMLALLLAAIEILVPSGGILALVAGGVAIASVVCFFRHSVTWGLLSMLAVMILAPTTVAFALKIWPETYFGRRMILGGPDEDEEAEMLRDRAEQERVRQSLVGVEGEALTDLRPVGTVLIEGERVEALAAGGIVEAHQRVRVVSVEGRTIKVRAIS